MKRTAPPHALIAVATSLGALLLAALPQTTLGQPIQSVFLSLGADTAICLPEQPERPLLMSIAPITTPSEESTADDEVAALTLIPVAIDGARDELHALINASKPDTWTCNARPAEIQTFDEMSEKLQRRYTWWWRSSEQLRARFGYDLEHWRKMIPLYQEKKVCNLRTFVLDGITEIAFLGVPMRVNSAIAPKLKRVERRLIKAGITASPFEKQGGFHPRTTRGPFGEGKHLSRHGLGIAIDFDWHENPYFSRRELNFVQELTGVTLKRSATIDAGKRWDNINRANTLWMERIQPWLETTRAEIETLKETPRGRRSRRLKVLQHKLHFVSNNRNLSRAIDNGFLSLPRALVVAMEAEGLTWATDFPSGPDLMHFEDRSYDGNPKYHRKPWQRRKHNKPAPKAPAHKTPAKPNP